MRLFFVLILVGTATLAGLLQAKEPGSLPWDLVKLKVAPAVSTADVDLATVARSPKTVEGINVDALPPVKTIYFEGLPYQGKPTKVFAFYGAPADASPTHKVPAVILVHGAGGTAYVDWVRLWVSRGYAALALDDEGQIPVGTYGHWTPQPDGGPKRADVADLKKPLADQWMYHAVADVLLAHALLRSFPEIDGERIGLIGISWGGVITAVAAGVDSDLKFAVPVYGCGFISDPADDGSEFVGAKASPAEAAEWRRLWDPANFLPRAKLPMLWVSGMTDFAFTPRARQRSYQIAPGAHTLSLRPNMPHSHNGPGETPAEIAAFADSIAKGTTPLAQIDPPTMSGSSLSVHFQADAPVKTATLNFTRESGPWQQRKWESVSGTLQGSSATAPLPDGITAAFFTLVDSRGLQVASEHISPIAAPSGKPTSK